MVVVCMYKKGRQNFFFNYIKIAVLYVSSLNCTILECKSQLSRAIAPETYRLNCTILECKFKLFYELIHITNSLNCTILECKCM